jgi:hypothetical protein
MARRPEHHMSVSIPSAVTMKALPRVHQQSPDAYAASWNSAIDALDPREYPYLHALRPDLISAASADQFEYGLNLLVESLRTRATSNTAKGRRPGRTAAERREHPKAR